jgi:hypothetical protein
LKFIKIPQKKREPIPEKDGRRPKKEQHFSQPANPGRAEKELDLRKRVKILERPKGVQT